MKIKLSEFIKKAEMISTHPNVVQMVGSLKAVLESKGDIEIDLEHMCKTLGVKID